MPEQRVCDHCRRRKARCDRGFPCTRCQGLHRQCTYSDTLRKRGPRFLNLYARAFKSGSDKSRTRSDHDSSDVFPTDSTFGTEFSTTHDRMPEPDWSSPGHIPKPDVPGPDYGLHKLGAVSPASKIETINSRRIVPSTTMVRTIHLYIKHIYPLMPVFDINEVLQSLSNSPRGLAPERYAFLSSLCAATHCHRNSEEVSQPCEPLLADALWARTQYDIIADNGLEGLLSSFFLFIAYWSLNKASHAWFYLRETISLALARRIHRVDEYEGLVVKESDNRRTIFWSLLVSESTFCLMYDRPMVLQLCVNIPQPRPVENGALIQGFTRICRVFESLAIGPPSWTAAGFVTPISWRDDVETGFPVSQDSDVVSRIQNLESLMTRYWLEAKMWKLAANRSPAPFYIADEQWDFQRPVVIGESVLDVLDAYSAILPDSPGIALHGKLHDIADCVCDVAPILQQSETSTVDLGRIVSGILTVLSTLEIKDSHSLLHLQRRADALFG